MAHAAHCPECGHELSMFEEDEEMSSAERLATAIAERVASWWFAGTLLGFVAV